MSARPIRIGTRGSDLAMAQTTMVRDALAAAHPDCTFEIEVIRTTGDHVTDVPLAQIGGMGVFTKELEAALLDKRVDVAVHSLKDLPTQVTPGLCIAAVSRREDAHDAFISRKHVPLGELPEGAVIGTSSPRRSSQLLVYRRDLRMKDIRGNVPTRIRKLHDEQYDAIVLAYAGLIRLGLTGEMTEVLPFGVMLPAPAQGAIGVECRDESDMQALLAAFHDPATAACARAERAFLDACGGGCSVPIGGLGRIGGDALELQGVIAAHDGSEVYRGTRTGPAADPEGIGRALAEELLAQGASAIIEQIVRGS